MRRNAITFNDKHYVKYLLAQTENQQAKVLVKLFVSIYMTLLSKIN